jgi:hypothetical protein
MSKFLEHQFLTTCALLISMFFLPWWAVLLLLTLTFLTFKSFYAGVFLGWLMDLWYGAPPSLGFPFPFLLTTALLALLLFILKRRLVFWNTPRNVSAFRL